MIKSSLYSLFNKSSKLDLLCVSVKTFVWTCKYFSLNSTQYWKKRKTIYFVRILTVPFFKLSTTIINRNMNNKGESFAQSTQLLHMRSNDKTESQEWQVLILWDIFATFTIFIFIDSNRTAWQRKIKIDNRQFFEKLTLLPVFSTSAHWPEHVASSSPVGSSPFAIPLPG